MANFVYIATSLDGFIATVDGGLDWLDDIPHPEQDDYGYAEFLSSIDAIVMGRVTFEKVLTFGDWPYIKPVFVLSNTLQQIPQELANKVKIIRANLKEQIANLETRDYNNLYIDGGRTIQSFLKEDLIDELIITRVPILLGDGIPLFGNQKQSLQFQHKQTDVYPNGLVKSAYTRKKSGY